MRMANVCTPRLARFALYSSPAWLKTLSDGADVAVMPKSSRAELDNQKIFSFSKLH